MPGLQNLASNQDTLKLRKGYSVTTIQVVHVERLSDNSSQSMAQAHVTTGTAIRMLWKATPADSQIYNVLLK